MESVLLVRFFFSSSVRVSGRASGCPRAQDFEAVQRELVVYTTCCGEGVHMHSLGKSGRCTLLYLCAFLFVLLSLSHSLHVKIRFQQLEDELPGRKDKFLQVFVKESPLLIDTMRYLVHFTSRRSRIQVPNPYVIVGVSRKWWIFSEAEF